VTVECRHLDGSVDRLRMQARGRRTALAQVFPSGHGHRYEPTASGLMTACHKTPVVGVLPHRQTWTRRPPGVEHVSVRARSGAYPFEKVEDQRLHGVGHRSQ
jgi:hypothetical protein